ncbi:hypothetical protein [Sphingobium subterraneum]|uniref:hypothetical protein n=1 Tax=Sphingobium subterraneum TaxID=627688 RepID=UPI001FE7E5D7|nr:hypothetical protein [Sphingobium subterraneum]
MERSAHILTLVKLANVGLSMLWGFAVTYVFVRVLPPGDFRAFLLLVAFNNFTISAEFGLTNIIYARLRRFWLGRSADGDPGDFRPEEMGVLFLFLLGLIGLGTLVVAGAIAGGWIATSVPLLFVLFFIVSALNVLSLLAKRGLAAVDGNILWEGIDLSRRAVSLVALIAVLFGFDLMASVLVQLVVSLLGIGAGIVLLQRRTGMRTRQWVAWRVGGGHIRRLYLRDIGASVLLTLSEITAYNAPYFTIAALSHDPRLLLLFDFVFKMSRAVSTAIRATVEAVLPGLTSAWFRHDARAFGKRLLTASGVALGIAGCAALLLLAIGQRLFDELFGGRAHITLSEQGWLCVILMALALICVSVYVQGALSRFAPLLRQSLPFLAGSLLTMPLALGAGQRGDHASAFMAIYGAVFVATALLHIVALRRLLREAAA